MIVFPNAKINIGLRVVFKRPDGYHNLETIFYPVKLTDALEMIPSRELKLSLSGLPVDQTGGENLVLKAWHLLKNDFNLPPVHFHLHKKIPTGAGLGGGSSDAAFTLKMVNKYFDLQLNTDELKDYAGQIGADCPFFIENKPVFAEGTGNRLTPVSLDLSSYQLIILKPAIAVSTAEAYREVVPAPAPFCLKEIINHPPEKWRSLIENDFEKSIFRKYPEIEQYKNALYEMGALFAAMSGSGSAVFGLFKQIPGDLERFFPEERIIFP